MIRQEFKNQIFKTPDQWKSGLLYRLKLLKKGGVTLYSVPSFTQWIQGLERIKISGSLAADECGLVYFIADDTYRIYRYDPEAQSLEHIPCIGGRCSDFGKFKKPERMIIDRLTLWVLDTGNKRIQAFSRDNFQIKYVIEDLKAPVDMGQDAKGNLYVLDEREENHFNILTYDANGNCVCKKFKDSCLKKPVGLAVGLDDAIYIIDTGYKGFLKFLQNGTCSGPLGNFNDIQDEDNGDNTFKPSIITIDRNGNIFAADFDKLGIHQFDPDGSHIGRIPIPDFEGPFEGLAVDPTGNLFASSSKGLAFLGTRQSFTKMEGVYYSKSLDSGIKDCQWHRLKLKIDLPPRTMLDVCYFASDEDGLKRLINKIISDDDISIQKKVKSIDQLITWSEPEKNPKDMLFRDKTGRFLWLKLILFTFDETAKPEITQMKVYYPRTSYLRYLPAVYQENPSRYPHSKEFLERFLSIFEAIFYDLEDEISCVFEYFDPDNVSQDFLEWLASWLNIALEEDWPEDGKRKLICEAAKIYKIKGTPAAIKRLVEIYTGRTPLILEHSRIVKPVVLGRSIKLGLTSFLVQTFKRDFRPCDGIQAQEDPFQQMAHSFTIIFNFNHEEFIRFEKGLKRILDEAKPAHTNYTIRNVSEIRVGMDTYIEINTRVVDYRPVKIREDSILGTGLIVYDNGENCGKVERRSKVKADTILI